MATTVPEGNREYWGYRYLILQVNLLTREQGGEKTVSGIRHI
jgi:hypothetical protein